MNAAVDLSKIVKPRRSLISKRKGAFNKGNIKRRKRAGVDDGSDEDESLIVKKCQDDGDLKHYEKR